MVHDPWSIVHYLPNHTKTTIWDSRSPQTVKNKHLELRASQKPLKIMVWGSGNPRKSCGDIRNILNILNILNI